MRCGRLANKGNVYPIGQSTGQVDVAGSTWDLWDGYNGDMHVYSFVAPGEVSQIDFDINSFFNHLAAAKGFPKDSQHLLSTWQKSIERWRMTLTSCLQLSNLALSHSLVAPLLSQSTTGLLG